MAYFRDIVGEEAIKGHLQNALTLDKVSHAYIFHGEKGMGKKMMAKTFAMALQCETGGEEPCHVCRACKQTLNGNHPDIKIITHEKPNTIGVDEIRNQINADIEIKPYQGPKKIYIVPDAEKMTVQAQNALLKTLEEPPHYAVIILLTNSLEVLLQTILSRCVLLNFMPIPDAVLKDYLMKEEHLPDYKAKICTAFARGNLGKALMLGTSEEFDELKNDVLNLLKNIGTMEISDMVTHVKHINETKCNTDEYLDLCTIWYRDVLLFKATNDVNQLIFKEEIQAIRKDADARSYEGIEKNIEALKTARNRLHANVNQDLTLELLFLALKERS